MGKKEVIARLKEHLQYCKNDHKKIKNTDKNYCIRYIMDFLSVERAEAVQIYQSEVL